MKKIRRILPAFAILFAVAAALVTYASPKASDEVVVSYELTDCEPEGICDTTVGGTCLGPQSQELRIVEDIIPCENPQTEGEFIAE